MAQNPQQVGESGHSDFDHDYIKRVCCSTMRDLFERAAIEFAGEPSGTHYVLLDQAAKNYQVAVQLRRHETSELSRVPIGQLSAFLNNLRINKEQAIEKEQKKQPAPERIL